VHAEGVPRHGHEEHQSIETLPLTIVERQPTWRFLDLGEMWRYRELLYFLVWRDVKVRYKETVLGALWAVLQPLSTMVVFTLFMGKLLDAPTEGLPYPLFVFAGLIPWTFLSNAIGSGGQSVIANQKLVTKVHFPRVMIPMGTVSAGLVDFGVAFLLLVGMMVCYGVGPGLGILALPIVLAGLVATGIGIGVLLSALTVTYRDFRHVIPFLVQIWMFATPSIYMFTNVKSGRGWAMLLPLNPAYGLIANFRMALVGRPLDWYSLIVSLSVAILLFVVGCVYFRRVERNFADLL
jgi:lipopolysaccharide transport system permease protein